jgi:N-acetylmuramate 1-kinase
VNSPSPSTVADARLVALTQWLHTQLPARDFTLAPASSDASFRRYLRVTLPKGTLIAMDAPPPHEDCRPFVQVAALLREAGVHAPQVLAQDLEQGFLLLSDLGTQTYLQILNEHNADALFGDAIAVLLKWQHATRENILPPYDETLLRRELGLFPDWYVQRHLGVTLTEAQRKALAQVESALVANALAQPQVYVHRDYMPRNLMASQPNPGVLDFQDAVLGPITYDVASLFRDAFISWEEERALDWTIRYWEQAKRQGLPVRADFADFYRELEWMGLQRHLKVLGIFARLFYRDGKAGYLDDTPRFVGYARRVCERYAALAPLLKLFDELEDRRVEIGYTF